MKINAGWVVIHFAIFWIGEVVPYLLHQIVPIPISVIIGGHIVAVYGVSNLILAGLRSTLIAGIEVTELLGDLLRSCVNVLISVRELGQQVRSLFDEIGKRH